MKAILKLLILIRIKNNSEIPICIVIDLSPYPVFQSSNGITMSPYIISESLHVIPISIQGITAWSAASSNYHISFSLYCVSMPFYHILFSFHDIIRATHLISMSFYSVGGAVNIILIPQNCILFSGNFISLSKDLVSFPFNQIFFVLIIPLYSSFCSLNFTHNIGQFIHLFRSKLRKQPISTLRIYRNFNSMLGNTRSPAQIVLHAQVFQFIDRTCDSLISLPSIFFSQLA